MKSRMYLIALSLITIMILGCEKTKIDSDKLYRGKVILKDCPSFGIIEVTNSSIGKTWINGNKQYSNVIILANVPSEVDLDHTITFYIDPSSKYEDCLEKNIPCPMLAILPSNIDKYCSNNITVIR